MDDPPKPNQKRGLIHLLISSIDKLSDVIKGLTNSNKVLANVVGVVILIGLIIGVIKGCIEIYQMFPEDKKIQIQPEISDKENIDSTQQPKGLSFDVNPSNSTGIVSIIEGYCNNCSGNNNEITVNIPNPNDSTLVNVFLDFMVKRNSSIGIKSASAYFLTKNTIGTTSEFYFRATLNGHKAMPISDYAIVKGLPTSYTIEFISGFIENEHGGFNPNGSKCDVKYDYYYDVTEDLFVNGQNIGDLSIDGGSWCAQGTISVLYKIKNTEKQ